MSQANVNVKQNFVTNPNVKNVSNDFALRKAASLSFLTYNKKTKQCLKSCYVTMCTANG